MTLGDELRKDPRIGEAKKLLREAVADQQKKIKGVKAGSSEMQSRYEETLEAFARTRGASLYYPYLGSGLGKGSLVELADGSIKYDMINGIGPHICGHNHPGLLDTNVDSSIEDIVMQGNLQQNEECVKLSQTLIRASGLHHCFLSSSGAMANENALKIAFQKRHPANRILAFDRCFMGRTLVMSHITDKPAYREGIPKTVSVDYVPFYDHTRPEKSTSETLHALERHIKRHPGHHAVMAMELIQGEGGFYPGTHEFFVKVIKLLKEHEILVLADEVQTFGRTESLFAFHHFGLQGLVDICTIGKLSQVCATLFHENINPKPGLLSQTFTSSTTAIRAGQYIIDTLLTENYYGKEGKIAKLHALFVDKLKRLEPDLIKGPYGVGAMIAFTPFEGEMQRTVSIARKLYENGVITFIAGVNPTRIRMLIPVMVITEEEIDAVVSIIESTLRDEAK